MSNSKETTGSSELPTFKTNLWGPDLNLEIVRAEVVALRGQNPGCSAAWADAPKSVADDDTYDPKSFAPGGSVLVVYGFKEAEQILRDSHTYASNQGPHFSSSFPLPLVAQFALDGTLPSRDGEEHGALRAAMRQGGFGKSTIEDLGGEDSSTRQAIGQLAKFLKTGDPEATKALKSIFVNQTLRVLGFTNEEGNADLSNEIADLSEAAFTFDGTEGGASAAEDLIGIITSNMESLPMAQHMRSESFEDFQIC